MSPWHAIILGLVQGLTEFLPISSSAHLVFVPAILRLPPPPLAFDVLLHLGTLAAVVGYFHRDLAALAADAWHGRGRARRVVLLLAVGTLPAVAFGFLAREFIEGLFASPAATAWQLAVTGLLLAAADVWRARGRSCGDLNAAEAAFVGVGQALAIVPGISRSGATIAFGLWAGLTREEAARFSFLLAIPAILGAGLLEARSIMAAAGPDPAYLAGFLAAAAAGAASIAFFLRYLRRGRLWPFAVYCWLAAAGFLVHLAAR